MPDSSTADVLQRNLVEDLPAAVYTTDAAGRVTFFNRAAVELWGCTPSIGDELGHGCYRIYRPDGTVIPEDQTPMTIALREGRAVMGSEILIKRPDGTARIVLPHPQPLRDSAGEIVGGLNLLIDITDRKRTEDALRDSEDRLRLATQAGKLGMWNWDIAANHVAWSDSLYSIHGVTCEEFPATVEGFAALVHPEDRTRVSQAIARSLHEGEPYEVEFRAVRPSGEIIWLFTNATVIRNHKGTPLRMYGATMDITDRKKVETELRQAKDAAEAANLSKDKFLAVLSLELRTPLTPVLMTVAAMEVDPELAPSIREDVSMIRRNVELETKLIDDLLDLSRITSGKLKLEPQSIDINEAVRHVCGICRQQILEKGIRLHLEIAPGAARVHADPARLQQILWNILKNAAKFTTEGGEIFVTTTREHLAAERSSAGSASTSAGLPDRIRITIRDTGIGIAPELLPRIFDAFEQGDAAITRRFRGMGLGLAISKALVERHGGTIRAHSEGAGKGTIITIELPAVPAATEEPSADHPPRDTHPPELRLLVVEDHLDTARTLGRLLQASGYAVQTAGSVESALRLATAEHFDVVLTDIGLPDATGYELMQQLKHRAGVKGIAMSGYGMDDDIKRSREAGFVDHLVKLVTINQLTEAIRRAIDA